MMAFKFIGTLICFISVSSFEIKDSFDFEVVYGLQDEYVLNSFGLRRNLLVDSDQDEVLNEDELKDDDFVLKNTGLRRKLLVDSDSNEVLNEDELKEDEFVLKNMMKSLMRRKTNMYWRVLVFEGDFQWILMITTIFCGYFVFLFLCFLLSVFGVILKI